VQETNQQNLNKIVTVINVDDCTVHYCSKQHQQSDH